MRIAVSGIAWDPEEDDLVVDLLQRQHVDAVDLAPGKYVPDFASATAADVELVRRRWADRGFEITGMQSLLFGTGGLNVFGPPAVRRRMLDYLGHVCRIGGGLGAPRLVFGSPRQRDRSGIQDDAKVLALAVDFFAELGQRAAAEGVRVMLEPNPPVYGANFMTDAASTAEVVRAVDHPSIAMQLDTGAAFLAAEDVDDILRRDADIVGHVHLSEPGLAPVGSGPVDHSAASAAVARHVPGHVVSIEMVRVPDDPRLQALEAAVSFVVDHYRTQEAA